LVNGDTETATERFGLFWPGKSKAQAVAQIPTSATLIPAPEESIDWDNTKNIYIEGDNLEVLKALQNSYRRKIKMIYIDPPYNTGKEFIYPDNYQEGLQTYLEYTGQKNEAGEVTESKKETGGRKHTNWLNMMYPRLQLAKSLLADDGVIFISIDDNEQANLRKLSDEVFGEQNFVACFVQKSRGGISNDKLVSENHNYIIMYSKNYEFIHKKRNLFGILRSEIDFKNYNKNDNDGKGFYALNPVSGPGGARKGNPFYRILDVEGYWRYGKEKMLELIKIGKVIKINNSLYQKTYKNVLVGTKKGASTWLNDVGTTANGSQEIKNLFENIIFDFPKPVGLIKFLLNFIDKGDNDVILDFFSGSATTAHAVMQLNAEDGGNRTHIQVQLPEPTDEKSEAYKAGYKTISDIGKERIRRAGKKILTDYAGKLKERKKSLDVGFRVYKLAPSNFVEWNEEKAKENIQQSILDFAENKKSDASPEALLAEIMLQSKITLDAKIEKKNLSNGGWVYMVDDGNLVAYVDDKQITEDQAKEIANMGPAKLVVVDSAFNGNDALKINIANICKEKFIKEFKTI